MKLKLCALHYKVLKGLKLLSNVAQIKLRQKPNVKLAVRTFSFFVSVIQNN